MTTTTVFVECVSCGRYQKLGEGEMDDADAARAAHRRGWTVAGFRGAKGTRCKRCRKARRTDTKAFDEGRLGKRAGRYVMQVRHP